MTNNLANNLANEVIEILSTKNVTKLQLLKALKILKIAQKKFPEQIWSGLLNNVFVRLGDFDNAKKQGEITLLRRNTFYKCNSLKVEYSPREANLAHCFSYSFFGKDNKYFFPLIRNIKTIKYYFNKCDVAIFVPEGTYESKKIRIFEELGAQVFIKKIDISNLDALCGIRFNAFSFDNYSMIHFRDADSLITQREILILTDILSFKDQPYIYNIRDHIQHVDLMLAGLFGSSLKLDFDWFSHLLKFNRRGADQEIANRVLWHIACVNSIQYDRFYKNVIPNLSYSNLDFSHPQHEIFHIGARAPAPNKQYLQEFQNLLSKDSFEYLGSLLN